MAVGPFRWTRQVYRAVCTAIAVSSLAVAGTGVYLVSQSGRATAVELDSVLEDFRATTDPAASGGLAAPAAGEAELASPESTTAPAAPPETTSTSVAPVTTLPTSTSSSPATTAPGPAPFARPVEGVYTYGTSGGEKISVAGANHSYPSEIYAVLTHTQCGYQLVLNILEEHVDTIQICLDGARLSLVQVHQRITFLGQTQSGAIVCNPAALFVDRAVPTADRGADCQAGSIKATGPVVQSGEVDVTVGGQAVRGSVTEWRWTAKGDTEGNGRMTWTFGPDGLPLRLERSSTTNATTPLGRVEHQEAAKFVLRSLTPQR